MWKALTQTGVFIVGARSLFGGPRKDGVADSQSPSIPVPVRPQSSEQRKQKP